MTKALIEMGVVGRPHGIKGEIGVNWHASYIPPAGSRIFIGQESPRPFEVAEAHWHKNRLLFTLNGVNDRNEAESLKGSSVFVDRSALPQMETDEVLAADMLGAKILLADGTPVGVLDHLEFPANKMLWAIKDADGREILFPAEPVFIKSLDPDSHVAIIDPPEGLLDIYNA